MNYFSHFVIDHQPGNHEYNTGLLLPDITRKNIKKFYPQKEGQVFSNHHREFLLACLKHYESDKKFHESDFFNRYYLLLNHEINNSELSGIVERKWFMSHIMLELLIDRVIVRRDKELLGSFYEGLLKVDENSLRSFLKFYGMQNDDDFFTFFNHFRSVQYIYNYIDNNTFMYSFNRIMMRAKVSELTQKDSEIMIGIMLDFEQNYFSDAEVMLGEMKAIFK